MRQHPTGQKTRRSDCHLPSSVDGEHVASPAATDQQCKRGRGLVRGPNPAALQITLPTKPTGTLQLCTSSKIRGEPGDNIPAQTIRCLQSLQRRVLVDTVKGS